MLRPAWVSRRFLVPDKGVEVQVLSSTPTVGCSPPRPYPSGESGRSPSGYSETEMMLTTRCSGHRLSVPARRMTPLWEVTVDADVYVLVDC